MKTLPSSLYLQRRGYTGDNCFVFLAFITRRKKNCSKAQQRRLTYWVNFYIFEYFNFFAIHLASTIFKVIQNFRVYSPRRCNFKAFYPVLDPIFFFFPYLFFIFYLKSLFFIFLPSGPSWPINDQYELSCALFYLFVLVYFLVFSPISSVLQYTLPILYCLKKVNSISIAILNHWQYDQSINDDKVIFRIVLHTVSKGGVIVFSYISRI